MADKYLTTSTVIDEDVAEVEAINTSAGAGDSGKIAALNASGQWSLTMMPTGIGPDIASIVATETIAAGAFVEIYDDTAAFKIRNADAATGRAASGFILAGVADTETALVYFEGPNTQVSGATPGPVYLSSSTPGSFQATKPAGTGDIVQKLGVATSATTINFEKGIIIARA